MADVPIPKLDVSSLFGANYLLNNSPTGIGEGLNKIAQSFTDTGVRKTRNTSRDIQSQLLALNDVDSFGADASALLRNYAPGSYDPTVVGQTQTQRFSDLNAADTASFLRDTRLRKEEREEEKLDFESRKINVDEKNSASNILSQILARKGKNLEVDALQESSRQTSALRNDAAGFMNSIIVDDGKGNFTVNRAKSDLYAVNNNLDPDRVWNEAKKFQTVQGQLTQEAIATDQAGQQFTSALEYNAKNLAKQTPAYIEASEQADADIAGIVAGVQSDPGDWLQSDTGAQKELLGQYERYKGRIHPAKLVDIISSWVKRNGTVKDSWFGLGRDLEDDLKDAALEETKSKLQPQRVGGLE